MNFRLRPEAERQLREAVGYYEDDIEPGLYGVLYSEEEGILAIVAVMNLPREPGYWKGRS